MSTIERIIRMNEETQEFIESARVLPEYMQNAADAALERIDMLNQLTIPAIDPLIDLGEIMARVERESASMQLAANAIERIELHVSHLNSLRSIIEDAQKLDTVLGDRPVLSRFEMDGIGLQKIMANIAARQLDETPINELAGLPDLRVHRFDLDTPHPAKAIPRRDDLASEYCKNIVDEIREFDASLDEQHEVGLKVIKFGEAIEFHPTHIKSLDPDLVVFVGFTSDDVPFKLVQHKSQVSLMMFTMKRMGTTPKKPIGFSSELEDGN